MAPTRQTHLGSTTTKSLTIIDLERPSGDGEDETTAARLYRVLNKPATRNFIFRLPDELLEQIVELAASSPGERFQWEHATACDKSVVLILSRVCHRLKRIAQPILFRNITSESRSEMVPPSRPMIKFHRTLKENADLRQHCRSLYMHISDFRDDGKDDYDVAKDIGEWLTRTKSLFIKGGFEGSDSSRESDLMGNERTWSLIRQIIANFKNLEHLYISREGWGLYLAPIFKWITCPKLKTLEIHGISEWRHRPIELELQQQRTAPFTSLRLSDYEEGPEATSLLLQWPAILTHFEFESFYNNPYLMDYPLFESWLLVHRFSLKHVKMGYLSHRGSHRLFNATLFPNLEFLGLSRWQMDNSITFFPEDSIVLGPSLKTFHWDFSIYDQHSESWDSFGEAEVNWLRGLAEFAVSQKAALAKFEIDFTPDQYYFSTEETGYPWDRMDNLRDGILRPLGIDLVYNKPLISKSEWLQFLNDKRIAEQPEPEPQPDYQGGDIRDYFIKTENRQEN